MENNKATRTIHQAFADFNGKSYAFHHNDVLPGGGDYRRSVALEEFEYGKDGAILLIRQTSAGPAADPGAICRNWRPRQGIAGPLSAAGDASAPHAMEARTAAGAGPFCMLKTM